MMILMVRTWVDLDLERADREETSFKDLMMKKINKDKEEIKNNQEIVRILISED